MHRCVRCATTFEDNDSNILRGCTKCGSLFFLYIKEPEDAQQFEAVQQELKKQETTLEKEIKKEIEKRKAVKREAKKKKEVKEPKKPKIKAKPKVKPEPEAELPKAMKAPKKDVVQIGKTKFAVEDMFGIETVRVPRDGVYEINIDALMKKRPVIVLERGNVYFIHLPSAFEKK